MYIGCQWRRHDSHDYQPWMLQNQTTIHRGIFRNMLYFCMGETCIYISKSIHPLYSSSRYLICVYCMMCGVVYVPRPMMWITFKVWDHNWNSFQQEWQPFHLNEACIQHIIYTILYARHNNHMWDVCSFCYHSSRHSIIMFFANMSILFFHSSLILHMSTDDDPFQIFWNRHEEWQLLFVDARRLGCHCLSCQEGIDGRWLQFRTWRVC